MAFPAISCVWSALLQGILLGSLGLCHALSRAKLVSSVPFVGLAVQGLTDQPLKKQIDLQKKLRKITEKRFPEAKLFPLNTEQESVLLLHHLTTQKQRHLAFRDRRAYLLADAVGFVPGSDSALVGTLKVSGYVRGRSLNVNSLVHIVGHGDFQMSQVDATPEPFRQNLRARRGQGVQVQVDSVVLLGGCDRGRSSVFKSSQEDCHLH